MCDIYYHHKVIKNKLLLIRSSLRMDETFQQTTSLVWDYTVKILEVSEDRM